MNLTMSTSLSRTLRIFLFWELQIWTHTPQQAVSFGKGFDFSKQSWLYLQISSSAESSKMLSPVFPWRCEEFSDLHGELYTRDFTWHIGAHKDQHSNLQSQSLAPGYRAPQPILDPMVLLPWQKWVFFLCGSQLCFSIQRKHQHRIVAFSDLSDCSPGLDFHNFFL